MISMNNQPKKITYHDFVCLFITILKKKGISTLNINTFQEFILTNQDNQKSQNLIIKIDKDTIDKQLTEVMQELKNEKILCVINKNNKDIVYISKKVFDINLIKLRKEKYRELIKLVKEYRKAELTEMKNVISHLYSQEETSMDNALEGLNKILTKQKQTK